MPEPIRGVLVLGFPRSGTTLLRRLLGGHPEIAAPPEIGLFAAAARFLQLETIVDGAHFGVLPGLVLAEADPQAFSDRLRDLCLSTMEELAAARGASVWVEKNPFDVFHLDAIGDLLREAPVVFLCMVRHGMDVVLSVRDLVEKTDRYSDALHGYVQRNPRPSLAIAEAWRDAALRLLAFRDRWPEKTLLVRYEHLTADPEATLKVIGERIGVRFEPSHAERVLGQPPRDVGFGDWKTYGRATVDTGSVGRWKKLSRGHQWELARILGPALEQWSYEVPRGRPPPTGTAALRRQQLAMVAQSLLGQDHDDEAE